MMFDIIYNAEQISKSLKIPIRDIKHYVDEHGLPAFQECTNGKWKALRVSLEAWAAEYEKKHLKK